MLSYFAQTLAYGVYLFGYYTFRCVGRFLLTDPSAALIFLVL